jgi:hypothetical protein
MREIQKQFGALVLAWKEGTGYISNPRRICGHWAYQAIIRMGPPVVPLILRQMKEDGMSDWGEALRILTRQQPHVVPADYGKVKPNVEAWLKWGREHGYEESLPKEEIWAT